MCKYWFSRHIFVFSLFVFGSYYLASDALFVDIETESFFIMERSDNGYAKPPFIASIALVEIETNKTKTWCVKVYNSCKVMVRDFYTYLQKSPKAEVYSWSKFDEGCLMKYFRSSKSIPRIKDLIPIIEDVVLLPNYKLKMVEKFFGIERQSATFDEGQFWGVLVSHTLKRSNSCPYCAKKLQQFLKYNLQDVLSMVKIVKFLQSQIATYNKRYNLKTTNSSID